MSASLTQVSTGDLKDVRSRLAAWQGDIEITEARLRDWALDAAAQPVAEALRGLRRDVALRLLTMVIAERELRDQTQLQLVWTADDTARSVARDTGALVDAMFARARNHVLVAGYRFTSGKTILSSLHNVMKTHGVSAKIVMDIHQKHRKAHLPIEKVREAVRTFLDQNWAFGEPFPEVYYDSRLTDPNNPWAFNMHAKCMVVDAKETLVTSANFTHAAQAFNVELGVYIKSASFAREVLAQFEREFLSGRFARVEP